MAKDDIVKDPVCGMKLMKKDAVACLEYEDESYYFCADPCKIEFENNPESYATPKQGRRGGRSADERPNA